MCGVHVIYDILDTNVMLVYLLSSCIGFVWTLLMIVFFSSFLSMRSHSAATMSTSMYENGIVIVLIE